MDDLLEKIIVLARNAGDAIMDVYASDNFNIVYKSDNSPLTQADRAAHEIIDKGLAEISDYDIVSEEGDERHPKTEMFWLVDPVDGTKEFINRTGHFTVNIALIKDKRPVLGVVYSPVDDVYYCGDVETGRAFKIENGKRVDIKAVAPKGKPVIAVSRSHKDGRVQKLLDSIGEHEEIVVGSSLKLCLVAEGVVTLSPRLGPTSLWDTAAADAVVTAAGGAIKGGDGERLVYDPDTNILNPHFVAETADHNIDWKHFIS